MPVPPHPPSPLSPLPQADNCILLRMLSVARANRYRLVRTPAPGLYVESRSLGGEPDSETHPCVCNDAAPTESHCFLSLAQASVDDPIDEERVNCVLTSLVKSAGGPNAPALQGAHISELGKSHDIDVADLIRVEHAVRFFKPSQGIEIIVSAVRLVASSGRASPPPCPVLSCPVPALPTLPTLPALPTLPTPPSMPCSFHLTPPLPRSFLL
jgi:hypothetical protein